MGDDRDPCDDHDRDKLDEVWTGFKEIADDLAELFSELGEASDHSKRLEYRLENGIYDRATLVTPEGPVELSMAYYRPWTMEGKCNIDIPHDEIPDSVDLEECTLAILSSDGTPLLTGPIVDVGAINGLGGNTTVALRNGVGL